MEPCIHVITLAVDDLERALGFYRDGLGFDSSGVVGTEFRDCDSDAAGAIAMFKLQGGLILCVYPRSELAKDAGVSYLPPKSGEFSIGHAVSTRPEVDAVLARAEAAGATVLGNRVPALGHLLRVLPRSRWPPLGSHVQPGAVVTPEWSSL